MQILIVVVLAVIAVALALVLLDKLVTLVVAMLPCIIGLLVVWVLLRALIHSK